MHGEAFAQSGDPYTIVVRNVCKSCNNGWMSVLQDEAKPLVHALAKGEKLTFDEPHRLTLARWSAMVTINLECHARMLRTAQIQRTALMNGKMPEGWRVGIARMVDTDCAGQSFHRAVAVPIGIGNGDYLSIGNTYFTIERAAFHTMNSLSDQLLSIGLLGMGLSEVEFPIVGFWPHHSAESGCDLPDLRGSDLDNIQRHFGYNR